MDVSKRGYASTAGIYHNSRQPHLAANGGGKWLRNIIIILNIIVNI